MLVSKKSGGLLQSRALPTKSALAIRIELV